MFDAAAAPLVIGTLSVVCAALAITLVCTIILVRRYVCVLRKQQQAAAGISRHLLRLAYADLATCQREAGEGVSDRDKI